jgi:hypothetical protein
MDKTEHLLMLMDSCHLLAHAHKLFNDSWSVMECSPKSTLEYSFASSAKSCNVVLPSHTVSMSLMKIRNSIGPKTEPCGTPLATEQIREKQ